MSEPVIDVERLEAICGSASDVALELVEMLLDDATPLVAELAATPGDAEHVRETAHALKGIAGNVGAAALRSAAESLEVAARAGDRSVMQIAVGALQRSLDDVRALHADWSAEPAVWERLRA